MKASAGDHWRRLFCGARMRDGAEAATTCALFTCGGLNKRYSRQRRTQTCLRSNHRTIPPFFGGGLGYNPLHCASNRINLQKTVNILCLFAAQTSDATVRGVMKKLTRNFPWPRALCVIDMAWLFLTAISLALVGAGSALASEPSVVLFVESNVADYRQLATGAGSGFDVVVLDAGQDGLRQMADALEGRKNIAAVHVISHGARGALDLGALILDRATLVQRGADLAR
ncbi:MAG: DUF4347 domain-containing protein, partial [Comamonadaceae bacterium]